MQSKSMRLLAVFVSLSGLLWVLGACIGSSGFENPLHLWSGADGLQSQITQQVVWAIRLPRTLGAWACGALLGLSGALAQGLFRNPLADPYLLGSASGASLGVALVLAFLGGGLGVGSSLLAAVPENSFLEQWGLQFGYIAVAFVGALLAVLLVLTLARGMVHSEGLILAGVVVGMVLGAATSLVLFFSPESLQEMQAFVLGSTSFMDWTSVFLMSLAWLLCSVLTFRMARVLDGLSLGESTAASLGLSLKPMGLALIGVLALATATAVAQAGLIAFVGLVAPHLVRAIVQVSYRWMVLLASLAGALLLTSADLLARWLIAPQELPVGVLTAVLGGGYLLWLMQRRARGGLGSAAFR